MRKSYRITAAVLALSLVCASFAGCGKNTDDNAGNSGSTVASAAKAEAVKALAFKGNDIDIGNVISGTVISKGNLLYAAKMSGDSADNVNYPDCSILAFDKSGLAALIVSVLKQADGKAGRILDGISVDENGNISCVVGVSGDGKIEYRTVTYDGSGNEISSADLGGIITESDVRAYINGVLFDKSGNLYVNLGSFVRVFDKDGRKLFDTPPAEGRGTIGSFIKTNAGTPAIAVFDMSNTAECTLTEIDVNFKGFGKEYKIPASGYNLYSGSGEYLCFAASASGFAGIKADTLISEDILDLLALGIDNSGVRSFTACGDGSYVIQSGGSAFGNFGGVLSSYLGSDTETKLSVITAVDAAEVKEKQILTLGCFYADANLKNAVSDFNKHSEDYVINVNSYASGTNLSDYKDALHSIQQRAAFGQYPRYYRDKFADAV